MSAQLREESRKTTALCWAWDQAPPKAGALAVHQAAGLAPQAEGLRQAPAIPASGQLHFPQVLGWVGSGPVHISTGPTDIGYKDLWTLPHGDVSLPA